MEARRVVVGPRHIQVQHTTNTLNVPIFFSLISTPRFHYLPTRKCVCVCCVFVCLCVCAPVFSPCWEILHDGRSTLVWVEGWGGDNYHILSVLGLRLLEPRLMNSATHMTKTLPCPWPSFFDFWNVFKVHIYLALGNLYWSASIDILL